MCTPKLHQSNICSILDFPNHFPIEHMFDYFVHSEDDCPQETISTDIVQYVQQFRHFVPFEAR